MAAANSIPIDVHIEIMGANGGIIDSVKWAIEASPVTTWKKFTYGILAMVRKSKKDLPIDYTTAVFMLKQNKTNRLQGRIYIIYI